MIQAPGTTISDPTSDADRPGLVSVDEHRILQSGLRMAVRQLDDRLRLVVSYHMGWSDPEGRAVAANGGKSVRSTLALLAARAAGSSVDVALPGAIAVKLVHNFSLVHDDLIDRDTPAGSSGAARARGCSRAGTPTATPRRRCQSSPTLRCW